MGSSTSKESIEFDAMGSSTSKESINTMGSSTSKESIEFDATLASCRHLMQLLRSEEASIQMAALASLKEITANSFLSRVLLSGRDQSSSPAAAILCPAIVRLLQDSHAIPAINVSLSLDILLNLIGYLEDKSVKIVYQTTGLSKVLNTVEVFDPDISVEIQIKIRLLQLSGFVTDKDSIPRVSEQRLQKEDSMKRNFASMGAGRYGGPEGYIHLSKFKIQPALIEANIGKWMLIMTHLEGFVFYGKLESVDTKMGKFTTTETVQVIKRPIGRNYDYKDLKYLQIFFFDDCRTVEVVSEELVESKLAPWDEDDVDEDTKKKNDNMLTPWSKKTNADESNDVDNKMAALGNDDDNTKKENEKINLDKNEIEDNDNMLAVWDEEEENVSIIDRNSQTFIRI